MESKNRMSAHSNLMLVDIIHGNSSKYSQEDVLEAELELSRRGVDESEIETLKSKVNYIGGINIGTSSGKTTVEETNELQGSDPTLLNVLIGYIALTTLLSLFGLFRGGILSIIISAVIFGINIYGVYGLLNRKSFPVILLIGAFSLAVTRSIISIFSFITLFDISFLLIPIVFLLINAACLYFLTKDSMRKAYDLDGELVRNAIIVGVAAGALLYFV